jgi:hypothetical protein
MKKLLSKSFNVKDSNFFGGRATDPTYQTVTTTSTFANCTYETTTTTDDNDKFVSQCTDTTCN